MKVPAFIDDWMFRTYAPCTRGLPYYRVVFALYLLIFYLPAYGWLSGMPDTFFVPPISMAMFFHHLPPAWFFDALDLALEIGALCLLFGRQTRVVSFALCFGLILGNSFRYSIGTKIDHDILIPATLFCFGFSGWGDRLSWDERHARATSRGSAPAWPIALLMLIIGFCMFTAALPKATTGWASPHLLACRGQLIGNYLENIRPTPLTDFLLQIHSPLFWKMADWSTLAVEGSFIFCIFSVTSMRLVVTFAIFFHAFVYFTMDILFLFNLMAYASLFDFRRFLWKSWVRHPLSRLRGLAHQITFLHLLPLAAAMVGIAYLLWSHSISLAFFTDNVAVVLALGIAIGSLLSFVAALTDRLVFGHAFPLRSDHSLVILYDGECGLCDHFVQFVLKRDHRGIFRFAALQSPRAKEMLRQAGSTDGDLSTVVLLIDGRPYLRSTAALMVLRQLGGAIALLGSFGLVPTPLRDFVYRLVAKNRHRWFPKNDSCRLPTASEKQRFLS